LLPVTLQSSVEQALWTAYETLCENALLIERYARGTRGLGQPDVQAQLTERARWQWRRTERLRHLIEEGNSAAPADDAAGT
jgi:hypothetical protein